MINKLIAFSHWIKEHGYELIAGSTGFVTTISVDWNYLAGKTIETLIVATVNGTAAAAAGYITVFVLRRLLKPEKYARKN